MAMLTEVDQFYGPNYNPSSGALNESDFFGEGLASGLPQSRSTSRAGLSRSGSQFESIDDLISSRTPEALGILNQGSEEQLRLARLGTQAGLAPLQEVDDLRAFEEQQSILGQRGEEAQEFAIGNIPESQFDTELRRRQQQQLMHNKQTLYSNDWHSLAL